MKENPKLELMKVFNALKECRLDGISEVFTHKDIEIDFDNAMYVFWRILWPLK